MKRWFFALLISASFTTQAPAADINVFAAASLKGALDEIGAAFKAKTGTGIVATYAATGTLAKQIEQAAPADLFISADQQWMDYLAAKNLITPATRHDLVGNSLVLVAAHGEAALQLDTLPSALGADKLALADVASVPAGKYAKEALEKIGQWQAVEKNVVMQDNVRAALTLVVHGEAKFGVVYGSDVVAEPKVGVVATFPETSYRPIRYPIGVVATSQNAEARKFEDYLLSDEAKAIFKKDGFALLP